MPGISVRDAARDAALNSRFGHHFIDERLPPSLILNCGVSFPAMLGIYHSYDLIPVGALHHAMHQAWDGIAKYQKELRETAAVPKFGIVHSKGVVEFVLVCGDWALVHNNRIIFPIGPLHHLHPLNNLLAQDITGELWVNQGLGESHSALLLNC